MRRAAINKITGMSRLMLFSLSLLLLQFAALFATSGMLGPQEASAAVAALNTWPATPQVVLNGVPSWSTVASASGTVTVGAGSNRAMLVVVACEYTAAPTGQKLSVTYGGKSLSQIATNISQNSTIWLGYLDEADLAAAGSGQTLLVKNSKAAGLTAMYASAAVFSGVDQTASPLSAYSTQATASATSMTAPAYNVTAQAANAGLSLVVVNWNTTTATLTAPTGYTASPATYAGSNFRMGFYNKSITATGTEAPNPSVSAASAGAMVGFGLVPSGIKYTASVCSDCHYYYPVDAPTTRGTPAGQFRGSHDKHAGSVDGQYGFDCSRCHYNASGTNHSTGYKNISGSSVPRNTYGGTTNIAITNNPSFSTCTKSTCHSTGRSNIQYATSPTWGSTGNCLSCHAGRSATNPYPQANSANGFKLSTTHSQHLKYPAANVNCQMCHGMTAANHTTLKTYSGVMFHVNGVANVLFKDLSYGSYSSYKSTTSGSSANTKVCTNVACHGGTTRSAWTNQGAANNTHTCTHCHGQPQAANVPTNNTNLKMYAPGWINGANTGTSTDGRTATNDPRVGAHYGHLSSVYFKKLKCNECHRVPSDPFEGTHMTGTRYSSQTLTFAQASSANKNSVTPAFTSGNGATPATCTTTYCHGSSMPKGDTSGTARSPQWNQDTLITRTPGATECGRCHGNPPTAGTTSSTHTGYAATTSCSGCHQLVVNSSGAIINKALHMNGTVEASADCLGCHSALVSADFVRPSRHVNNGTTTSIVTNFDCIVCHAEGDPSSSGTTITRTTLHTGTTTTAGSVELRNVDNSVTSGAGTVNTNYWTWPNRRANGALAKGSANTAARDNMDRFCLGCHDANGSSTIAVNNSNNGLTVGASVVSTVRTVTGTGNTNTNSANLAQRPFNTNDKLQNTRDTALTGGGTTIGTHRLTSYGRVLNVKDQFNSTDAAGTAWASHHNLNMYAKRYTSNNTTAGTGLPTGVWTAYVTKENYTLNGTGAGTGANAGLHCSDCHLNEVNAHGAVNSWYMLNGSSTSSDTDIAPTQGNSSTSAEISCFRCHTANVYAVGGSSTEGRVDHNSRCNNVDVVTGTAVEAPFSNMCHGCHGGFGDTTQAVNKDVVGTGSTTYGRGALGAIHGNNETYTPGGGSSTMRYRFMSGASMRFWNPAGTSTTNWAASTAGTANCYTLSAADQWGSCTKHSGGASQTINKARALSY